MPPQKKYTPEKLEKAVLKYFKSISRKKVLTHSVATGEKDSMGHVIYKEEPVLNQLGKPVEVTEYIVPPTVGGLCAFLGIHRSTWNDYCNDEAFADTTTYAQGLRHAYLEQENLTRPGKDLKGIQFDLENNFGYRERTQHSVAFEKLEDFL